MSSLELSRDGADWPLREASRLVEAGGLSWHVQELGDGPSTLLLHGTAGATHSWRGLAPLLAEDFRLLAPDLPGHGFTTSRRPADMSLSGLAGSVAALLAKLSFSPKLVIGHSAGAAILVRLIANGRIAPDLFVAINGALQPFEGVAGHIFPAMARMLHLNRLAARVFAWRADRDGVAKLIAGMGSRLDQRGLDLYTRLMKSPTHCAAALDMMANWDLTRMNADLGRVTCPALLIVGAKDMAIRPAEADKVARHMSHARIESVPGAGHLAHEEQPHAVAALILAAAREAGLLPPS